MDPILAIVIFVTLYGYVMAAIAGSERAVVDGNVPPDDNELFFVLMVPSLNEAQVIGRTLSSLLAMTGNFAVLVIDDDSDDSTVAVVTTFLADPRVRLLRRPHEQARTGKGDSLNAGMDEVRRLALAERYGPDRVVVVVFDSDALVDADFLDRVAPLFRDPRTAGVQSAVRMYNAQQNLLTFWQHVEFIVWGEVVCRAKNRLGSATLGGNGQCVRLSALNSLGDHPWRASLVDDLDLALRLLTKGWRMRFCPSVAVWQEALPDLRRLVRQRSRWLQGHIVCWSLIPELLSCARQPIHARLDLLVFLLLPASFLPIGIASIGSWLFFVLELPRHVLSWNDGGLLLWYVVAFPMAPLAVWSWRRTSDRPGLRQALGHGHLFVLYSFVWFFASIVACWNVLLARRSWAKTSRVAPIPVLTTEVA
jgi:cellulose synthase/poly-beta-1,6-N-acetylglucosamine synthase-like glycosyltransferase